MSIHGVLLEDIRLSMVRTSEREASAAQSSPDVMTKLTSAASGGDTVGN